MRDIEIKKEHDGVTITIPFERIRPGALDIIKEILKEEEKEHQDIQQFFNKSHQPTEYNGSYL